MFHHPYAIAAFAWSSLVALTLQLDQGALIVALTSTGGPLLAVILAHQLARRTQKAIDEKLERQNETAALAAKAAQKAVADAEAAAVKVQATADETHLLVNSQRDALEQTITEQNARIATQDRRIESLELQLAQK